MRYQVSYRGKVQGVGFRATVADFARGLPVTGWVRNEPDGSVILVAEGKEEDLERFFEAVRQAMGEKIRSEELEVFEYERRYSGFEIR